MFAQTMNPSHEGMWTRVAPIAAVLAVAVGFVLALLVLFSAIGTSQTLMGHARLEQRIRNNVPSVVVQNQVAPAPFGG